MSGAPAEPSPRRCIQCGANVPAGAAECPQCGDIAISGYDVFPEIVKVYSIEIKKDTHGVKQTFLHAISAYTGQPANMQTIAPAAEGKTYLIVNVTKHFPESDVLNLGGLSPTAIVHDESIRVDKETHEPIDEKLSQLYAELDSLDSIEDRKQQKTRRREILAEIKEVERNSQQVIDFNNKIILFLDKPNPKTLENMKSTLSQDKYETVWKITDKNSRGSLKTKTVITMGFPEVLVASTRVAADDENFAQIVSRFDTISPNQSQEKYRAAEKHIALRKGTPEPILKKALQAKKFEWLTRVITAIKSELIHLREEHTKQTGAKTPNFFWIPFSERLGDTFPAEIGRNMRDFTRFITILHMLAATNVFNRPRLVIDGTTSIIVTRADLAEAIDLFFTGSQADSIFTGVSEKVLRFYYEVFHPCWEESEQRNRDERRDQEAEGQTVMVPLKPLWVTTGDLVEKSGEVWDREVPADTIRKEYLRLLEQVGYINSEDNPRDGRSKHYRPITGKTGNSREMRDTAYLSLESLKEAYSELGKLKESESEILIQDFDGSPLGLEELHRKYFDDFPRSESFIISGEEPAQPGQSSQNIAASRGSAQIPVNPLAQPSRQSITARDRKSVV